MKKLYVCAFLLITLILSSCMTSFGISSEQLRNINKGMTVQQVEDVLGPPSFRRFNDQGEELEFRGSGAGGWSVAIISFVDGKVTKMNSYFEPDCYHCNKKSSNFTGVSIGNSDKDN